ncbi:MAG TPA: hypothetical protein PLL06_14410 [Acidobacteriota bacterium]|nr:hypothetical protein [Acidobacteriota bacterium]HNB73576.1 hypothetical protein [Acidobacteriota bacterium]HND21083.1 hypothetical protein [Acidobacteriota bacterium]HNG95291.1 hypothetical protein [Acidobacteriota bacterium]HNH83384.1 hypothetical protein [Acidobacteriota bacterium]
MSLSKISRKRQVVIPEDICRAIGAHIGDFVEFVQRENDVLLKVKKVVDADLVPWGKPGGLPPAPSYEERMRMLKELEGDAEDDTYDIPIEEIRASRTRKELPVSLDE